MSSYVYALHEFVPENADEVSFKAGERILVLEKDDEYGDGWWLGQNSQGKTGLFPQSYTTSDAPDMEATLTDVQQAIEQLGRNRNKSNPSLSFASASIPSSRAESEVETTTDEEEDDIPRSAQAGLPGGFSHKGARRKLAEKARRAVEEAEKLEMLSSQIRSGPPIEVELSDESEAEEEMVKVIKRPVSNIPEEIEPNEEVELPIREEDELRTATLASFPESQEVEPEQSEPQVEPEPEPELELEPKVEPEPEVQVEPPREPTPEPEVKPESPPREPSPPPPGQQTPPSPSPDHTTSPPHTWTLPQVISWLKSKGFTNDVCEKFTEQEITGDVLLALDINLLKTEIGIVAFGKRMRIANAINELRRPESLQYSDTALPSPGFSDRHSRTQSLVPSTHSFPGSMTNGYGLNGLLSPESAPHTGDLILSPEKTLSFSPSDSNLTSTALGTTTSIIALASSERLALSETEAHPPNHASMRRKLFGRSADSTLSSNSKRNSSSGHGGGSMPSSPLPEAKEGSIREGAEIVEGEVSPPPPDTDAATTITTVTTTGVGKRHKVKKSLDADGTVNGKSHDRLSIFGSSFVSNTLGKGKGKEKTKGRKPPPRYSIGIEDSNTSEKDKEGKEKDGGGGKGSGFHIPGMSMGRKSSAGRPGSSDGTAPPTKETALLRKRTTSHPGSPTSSVVIAPTSSPSAPLPSSGGMQPTTAVVPPSSTSARALNPSLPILTQIGTPDFSGWIRKRGEKYRNNWKLRYCVLKGGDLYVLRGDGANETKIKGYINIIGYKVTVDETIHPGKYGFRIDHDAYSPSPNGGGASSVPREEFKPHYFSSDEKTVVRDWMKAIMKATIGRDYSKPVISSCNIPTIPLMVAQAMNPAPRPPSPGARERMQRAMRREDTGRLTGRDARVLMGLVGEGEVDEFNANPDKEANQTRMTIEDVFATATETSKSQTPPRPSRESRRNSQRVSNGGGGGEIPIDDSLIEWANSHLPQHLQIPVPPTSSSICTGLHLLRIAESIKGYALSPPVSDSAFPSSPSDDTLEGLFRLFDFMLDNDVRMGSVSINDVRSGKRDKIVQILKALKGWEERRRVVVQGIGRGAVSAGGFVVPV